jgi:CPA2 family monovalent cation:H+ antiporter-2
MPGTPHDSTQVFLELGIVVVGLAILARIANRWGFSAIPLYLTAGLCFGNGGLAPLHLSENFIRIGAEIGVLLLLFMLGLEYTGRQLTDALRHGLPAGAVNLIFNFTPGLALGFLLGWKPLAAVLLGGVTYLTSSGIAVKVLTDLKRLANPETAVVLPVLVFEDLTMAIYLPVVGVLLVGGGLARLTLSVSVGLAIVLVVLVAAVRFGDKLSELALHESDEIVLLTAFGTVLLVAGVAQHFQVSPAIAAFLVGIAASGPLAKQSHRLIAPLRDLFAATFFFFFGLEIAPGSLPRVLPLAIGLGIVGAATKIFTGYWVARRAGLETRGRWRAGVALVARGEFSIVIAGLGGAIEPRIGPLSAAYVLLLAIVGPILSRAVK